MRLHFLDLERLCFGVIHQTVVLRLVAARRRIVAEGKAAPKLLRHAGDGVLIFVVDGRLACAMHNLGIRAQLGGVYRAAPAIQAEAAGDVYRALQRNLRISILQIQRTIGIIFIRIRLIIGECAVLDDVLASAKLHGAAKVVRRRYRHMVQTCGVVLAGVLDLAHINAAGHSQIFQHQTIGRIILIPAVATIAKIDASINGAWMFGAVGDGQFLPCGVRAIELAPSLSGSKLQCQIVTIQAQVLEIIRSLIRENEMSMILITHDLGVVAETCDQVAIMYAGEVVEYGSVWDVYTNPKHPYTRGLFDSIPKMDADDERLSPIPGLAPNSTALPSGCYFHPRCKYCQERCREQSPAMKGDTHQYKCWLDFE